MKTRRLLWGLLAVTLVAVSAAFIWETLGKKGSDLPVLGEVADFTLTNQDSQSVSAKDLLGSVWVADFIYTTCPDQCPRMSKGMAKIQNLLPQQANVKLLSISVDPQKDRPKILAAYAEKFGADTKRWQFLTGKEETIHRVMQNFKLGGPVFSNDTGLIDHSSRLVLVDDRGSIRGYYNGMEEDEIRRLLRDLSALARPAQHTDFIFSLLQK